MGVAVNIFVGIGIVAAIYGGGKILWSLFSRWCVRRDIQRRLRRL